MVSVASRYVPGSTCLVQALAAQALLSRRHIPSRIRIGVAKGQEGPLQAHAWLECGNTVVIGGANLGRYTLLGNASEKVSHWSFCNG